MTNAQKMPIYRPNETDTPQKEKLQKIYDKFCSLLDGPLARTFGDAVSRIQSLSELKASLDISLDEMREIADKRLSSDVMSEYRSYFEGDDAEQLVDEVREAAKKAINLPDDTEIDMLLLDIVSPQKDWAIFHNIVFGDSGIYLILSPKHYMKILDYNGKEVQEQLEKIFDKVLKGFADKVEGMSALKKAIKYNIFDSVKDVFLSLAMQGSTAGASQDLVDKLNAVCIPGSHIDITKVDTTGVGDLKNADEYLSVAGIAQEDIREAIKILGKWYLDRIWGLDGKGFVNVIHHLEQAANLISLMLGLNSYVRSQEGDDKFVLTGSPLRDVDGLKDTMTLMVALKKAALPKEQGGKDCEPAKNAVKEWESGDYLRSISKESGDLLERKTSFLAGNIRHALMLESGEGNTYNIKSLMDYASDTKDRLEGAEDKVGYSYTTDVLVCMVFMISNAEWLNLTSEQRRFFAAMAPIIANKAYGEDGKISLPETLSEEEKKTMTQLGFGDVAEQYETLSTEAGEILSSKDNFTGFIKAQQAIASGENDKQMSDKEMEKAADMDFEKGQAVSKWKNVIGGEVLKVIVFNNPADDE